MSDQARNFEGVEGSFEHRAWCHNDDEITKPIDYHYPISGVDV